MKPSFQGLSDAELDICLKQAIDEDVSAGPPVDLEVLWARIDTEKRTVAAPIRKSRRQRSDFRKQTMVPLAAGLAIAVASVAGGVGIVRRGTGEGTVAGGVRGLVPVAEFTYFAASVVKHLCPGDPSAESVRPVDGSAVRSVDVVRSGTFERTDAD